MNKEIETLQNQVTNLTLENQKLRKDLDILINVVSVNVEYIHDDNCSYNYDSRCMCSCNNSSVKEILKRIKDEN
jgi:hypothetical protein